MSKTYVLETEWSWDETHRELCSFALEDFELEQNDPAKIFNAVSPRTLVEGWLRRFKLVAEAQNGDPMRTCKLVRLWWVEREAWDITHNHTLTQKLYLVGEFNENGLPVLRLDKKTASR